MLLIVALLAAAPFQCPKGTTHHSEGGEESCLDAGDKLHGPREFRDEHGVLLHRAVYDHGVALSQATFFPDGSKQSTRSWSDGKRDGTWDLYSAPGKLLWHREYSSGRLVKESAEAKGEELMKQVIAAHQGEVRFCFEERLQKDKTLEGKVIAAFSVGLNGDVTEASLTENTVKDPEVGRCVLEHVKKWEFPRQSEPVDLELPWVFKHPR